MVHWSSQIKSGTCWSHFLISNFQLPTSTQLEHITNGGTQVKGNMKAGLINSVHNTIVQWFGLILGINYPVANAYSQK